MAPAIPYAQSLQSCPTLCDPMEGSLPDSSVHGIFLARILEWVAMSSPSGSSWPRDQTPVSYLLVSCALAGRFLTTESPAFSNLTKHLSHNVTITFVIWGTTAKPAWISSSFLKFHREICSDLYFSNLCIQFFFFSLSKSRTFTFSLKGIFLQLVFGIFELPASLLLCFGVIIK